MRKILLPLILLLTMPASANVGAHAGFNFANVSWSSTQATDSHFGLILGGHDNLRIDNKFSINSGLQFAQRGFDYIYGPYTTSVGVKYLETFFYAKGRFPTGENFVPWLSAGPNIGLKIASDCSLSGAGIPDQQCALQGQSIEPFNLAFDLGAGGEFAQSEGQTISVGVRYMFGLTNISKSSSVASIKNKGLTILVGIDLP